MEYLANNAVSLLSTSKCDYQSVQCVAAGRRSAVTALERHIIALYFLKDSLTATFSTS